MSEGVDGLAAGYSFSVASRASAEDVNQDIPTLVPGVQRAVVSSVYSLVYQAVDFAINTRVARSPLQRL